jgi:hypothetical protein
MGFVGRAVEAGSVLVAAGGSALIGSDSLGEVSRQTVRPLVVRRCKPLLGCRAPETLGEHSNHEIAGCLLHAADGVSPMVKEELWCCSSVMTGPKIITTSRS